jgi:uncharacterized protein (DUF2062 family)
MKEGDRKPADRLNAVRPQILFHYFMPSRRFPVSVIKRLTRPNPLPVNLSPKPESNPTLTPARPRQRSSWRRWWRYLYIRFLRLRGHPTEIARGLAAGVFAGSYPLFGVQTIMGVAIAAVIRGNKLMAAAGTWISNPLTYVPIYAFNYQVGRWLLRQPAHTELFTSNASVQGWTNLGLDITLALFTGSTLVGLVLGVASYYGGLIFTRRIRRLRQRRKL